jgi:hypothetical protein
MPLSDEQLALKKRLLQHRSALLRTQWSLQVQSALSPVQSSVARVQRGGQWLTEHPWLTVGVLVAAVVGLRAFKPHAQSALAGARLALRLWQSWQSVQALAGARAPSSAPATSNTQAP